MCHTCNILDRKKQISFYFCQRPFNIIHGFSLCSADGRHWVSGPLSMTSKESLARYHLSPLHTAASWGHLVAEPEFVWTPSPSESLWGMHFQMQEVPVTLCHLASLVMTKFYSILSQLIRLRTEIISSYGLEQKRTATLCKLMKLW